MSVLLFGSKLARIPEGPEISRRDRIRKLAKLREELCAENRRVVEAQSGTRLSFFGRRAQAADGEGEIAALAGQL